MAIKAGRKEIDSRVTLPDLNVYSKSIDISDKRETLAHRSFINACATGNIQPRLLAPRAGEQISY